MVLEMEVEKAHGLALEGLTRLFQSHRSGTRPVGVEMGRSGWELGYVVTRQSWFVNCGS